MIAMLNLPNEAGIIKGSTPQLTVAQAEQCGWNLCWVQVTTSDGDTIRGMVTYRDRKWKQLVNVRNGLVHAFVLCVIDVYTSISQSWQEVTTPGTGSMVGLLPLG